MFLHHNLVILAKPWERNKNHLNRTNFFVCDRMECSKFLGRTFPFFLWIIVWLRISSCKAPHISDEHKMLLLMDFPPSAYHCQEMKSVTHLYSEMWTYHSDLICVNLKKYEKQDNVLLETDNYIFLKERKRWWCWRWPQQTWENWPKEEKEKREEKLKLLQGIIFKLILNCIISQVPHWYMRFIFFHSHIVASITSVVFCVLLYSLNIFLDQYNLFVCHMCKFYVDIWRVFYSIICLAISLMSICIISNSCYN